MKLSRVHFPVTALGPGHRIGIWFQGCAIRCEGCISIDTWHAGDEDVDPAEVLALTAAWADEADGATISGGEPFEQPDALRILVSGLRAQLRPDADILVYSGHPLEALHLEGLDIDALITDPFILDRLQTLSLRGSDNQRLHCLTPLGRQRYGDHPRTAEDDRLDVVIDAEGDAWMAGIPRRGDLERLRRFLAANGARAATSEHGR